VGRREERGGDGGGNANRLTKWIPPEYLIDGNSKFERNGHESVKGLDAVNHPQAHDLAFYDFVRVSINLWVGGVELSPVCTVPSGELGKALAVFEAG